MDDFLGMYLWVLALSAIGFILFWGAVIYLVIKFFKSDSGLSTEQKLGVLTRLSSLYGSGRASSEPGPVETEVRGMAAREGIDLGR